MTANRFASIVALLCVFFPMTFPRGEAIICYECNSEYDPRCGDPFDPYSLGTVNCSFQPRLEHLSTMEPTICRKISQRVYGKERVVRGCGYITDERDNRECLLRTGTHDVRAEYCSCTGDLCNGATTATGSPSVLLPAAAALLSLAFFAFSVLPPATIRLSSIPSL